MSLDELDLFYEEAAEPPAEPLATDEALVETMVEIARLRGVKTRLEADLKDVNKVLKEKSAIVLATYDARGITQMRVKEAGLFYIRSSNHPSVINKEKLIGWFDENQQPEMAPRTVNHQTLKSWWKNTLEVGNPLPPADAAVAFLDRTIAVRKG